MRTEIVLNLIIGWALGTSKDKHLKTMLMMTVMIMMKKLDDNDDTSNN